MSICFSIVPLHGGFGQGCLESLKHWIRPPNLLMMLQGKYRVFGCRMEGKVLNRCAMFALIWSLRIECNNWIFHDMLLFGGLVWDKVVQLA